MYNYFCHIMQKYLIAFSCKLRSGKYFMKLIADLFPFMHNRIVIGSLYHYYKRDSRVLTHRRLHRSHLATVIKTVSPTTMPTVMMIPLNIAFLQRTWVALITTAKYTSISKSVPLVSLFSRRLVITKCIHNAALIKRSVSAACCYPAVCTMKLF